MDFRGNISIRLAASYALATLQYLSIVRHRSLVTRGKRIDKISRLIKHNNAHVIKLFELRDDIKISKQLFFSCLINIHRWWGKTFCLFLIIFFFITKLLVIWIFKQLLILTVRDYWFINRDYSMLPKGYWLKVFKVLFKTI